MADEKPTDLPANAGKKDDTKGDKKEAAPKASGDFWATASTGTIVGLGILLYVLINNISGKFKLFFLFHRYHTVFKGVEINDN